MHVILFEPEIPPNTGNIIRLCANAGATLHLVKPLGFRLDERSLRRAGLDYSELAQVQVHDTLDRCREALPGSRLIAIETQGPALRAGNPWFAAPAAAEPGNCPGRTNPDAARQPQSQPLECRRAGALRGMAAVGFRVAEEPLSHSARPHMGSARRLRHSRA